MPRRTDLWEKGLHMSLVGDADVEGYDREGRADSGGGGQSLELKVAHNRAV